MDSTLDAPASRCRRHGGVRHSRLAEGYISRGIFHRKYIADALHVAIASFHKIDYLVTWNFGHLANVRRQARIKLFNTAAGFYVPMIVTPEFLVSEATERVS